MQMRAKPEFLSSYWASYENAHDIRTDDAEGATE
jgi:hypothetical protein